MVKDRKKVWAALNARRIYWIFLLVFLILSIFAPNFFNAYNIGVILGTAMLNGMARPSAVLIMT